MDSSIYGSFLTQSKQQIQPSQKYQEKRDMTHEQGEMFSRMLEEEDKDKMTKDGSKTERSVISGSEEGASAKKEEKVKNQEVAMQQDMQEQIKKQLMILNPTMNRIYNLAYKNPDVMNMSEKEMMGLMETPDQREGMQEFQKLLKEKGLKLSDLSFKQIAQLVQCKTKSQSSAFLDKFAKELKSGEQAPAEKTNLVEKGKENKERREAQSQAIDSGITREPVNQSTFAVKEAFEMRQNGPTEDQQQTKRKEVIDQIVKRMDVRNFQSKTELAMRLNPEYLGELKMNLRMDGNRMNAEFLTTSREVKELLEMSKSDLMESFSSKGLKLDNSYISLVSDIDEESGGEEGEGESFAI